MSSTSCSNCFGSSVSVRGPTRLTSSSQCLPCPAKRPPAGRGWIHEIKHDGYHIMARRNDDGGCGCLPGGL
jgi:hypothetical protein